MFLRNIIFNSNIVFKINIFFQNALLEQWNLSCGQNMEDWPLKIPHEVLAVYTRVVLYRFSTQEKKNNPYALHALNSFLTSLKHAAVKNNSPCKFSIMILSKQISIKS